MLVALSAQRHPLRFQHFVHARQARSDHRVVQRFADHARQMQPQLSPRGFPSILALGPLVHGGLLLLPTPIFRSGEECRHSNLNNLQDIAAPHPFETYRSYGVPLTLATDDAGISRIDLTHEYQRAADTYLLHYIDLKQLARNSLEYAFLPGKSLWQSTAPFVRTDECINDSPLARRISAACRNLLKTS